MPTISRLTRLAHVALRIAIWAAVAFLMYRELPHGTFDRAHSGLRIMLQRALDAGRLDQPSPTQPSPSSSSSNSP
jgi:hypothetical protein